SVICNIDDLRRISFLTSLLYSISNFQGAFLCDHRHIAATSSNITWFNNKCNPFFCFFINHIKTSRTAKVFPWFCQTVLYTFLHFLCHSKKKFPYAQAYPQHNQRLANSHRICKPLSIRAQEFANRFLFCPFLLKDDLPLKKVLYQKNLFLLQTGWDEPTR
ncbi:hypothetical protein EDC32_1192, partial [Laceyella sacchari]